MSGHAPASPLSTIDVTPHPLASSSPRVTPDLSGLIDGVSTKIAVVPGADLQSGIIVKAGGPTWGGMAAGGDPDYGKGQFISFHKWGTGLSDDPNNTLMFRVDKTGGLGLTGAVHIATGLRQAVGYSVTQAVWINPNLDTTFVAMTGVAGQTLPFLYATNSVGTMLFEVFASGAVQSKADIAARIGASTQVAMGDVAGFPSIQFGNDSTTFIARGSIAGRLQVTSYLDATKEVVAELGQTDKQVVIGEVFGAVAGIGFGTALDTVIGRTFPGFLQMSNNFHVKNVSYPGTAVLTVQTAAGQTGKAIRGLDSTGAEVWSISAAGVLSPTSGTADPLILTTDVVLRNSSANQTLVGLVYGASGIAFGSAYDAYINRASAGALKLQDTLQVLNTSHPSAVVLQAVGASGQSGLAFACTTNVGGNVFTVTIAGAVTGTSLSAGTGAITGGALTTKSAQITATSSGSVALAAFGVAGQSASLIAALNSGGGTVFSVSNAGAVVGNSFLDGSSRGMASGGGATFASLNLLSGGITSTGPISGATTVSASSTGTFSAVSATGGTSFFAAISVSSVASSGGLQGTTLSLSGSITGATTIAASSTITSSSTVTGTAFSATTGTSFFKGIVGTTLAISGAKSFVIDHPIDSARQLVHACIEGPEAAIYYRGRERVGDDGSVLVELPSYFEHIASTEGRTVQLTAVYDPSSAPGVLAASQPIVGSFLVVGAPGAEFFWRVEAARCDIDPLDVEPLRSDEWTQFDSAASLVEDVSVGQDAHDQLAGMAAWEGIAP